MKSDQPSVYLEAKISTASPAQLHLMLIEGALRFGRQAEQGLLREDDLAAHPPLLRALDIVEEMLAGVKHSDSEINEKLAQLYAFVYRELTGAFVNTDHKRMTGALKILEFQRETWRQACEKVAADGAAAEPSVAPSLSAPSPAASKQAAPKPHLGSAGAPTQGLSIEA